MAVDSTTHWHSGTTPVNGYLMEKTTTRTGLRVTVDIIAAPYPTGVKAPVNFKETMALVFDDLLPKWNYRALPPRLGS
jgi:hypothetical protein